MSEDGKKVVEDVFGKAGLMAQRFPGYEPRKGQVEYASAVLEAMTEGTRLLAEGPTGTGKSVGYLVPAIWHVTEGAAALREWRDSVDEEALAEAGFDGGDDARQRDDGPPRVLVVTANIALQEQLMSKDIPLLQELLPWPFTAAIAKGRANYLCLDRFDDSATELLMEPLRDPEERARWNEIARWKEQTETGDFSELPFEIGGGLRQRVSISSDDCTGKACARYADCHAEKARKRFKSAQVLVTNYHMLFAHLSIAGEFGVGVLPRFDIVVMDEAHEAADVARDFFGFTIREGSFKWATRFLGPKAARAKGSSSGYDLDPELRADVLEHASRLFAELRAFRAGPKYYARLQERFGGDWPRLVANLRKAANLLDKAATLGATDGMPSQRAAELRKARRRCSLLAANLEMGLDPTRDEDGEWAFFLEEEQRGNVSLRAKPIDVSAALKKTLFDSRAIRSVIVTSATLATGDGGDAFNFAAGELGCRSADELIVASPFDFAKQALLVVPNESPDPKDKDFAARIGALASDVVELSQGRMLGLFTSYRGVHAAADAIRRAHGGRYTLLVQGDAPRTQLIKRFREDVNSVLLGTRSMWAGVDVSGESLSVVFIDKLPFDPPDDPILDAKSELSRKTFVEYSVPRASIALRQGFGRLVRSLTDRGVVVIGDSRLVVKGYGKKIRGALPRSAFSRDLDDVGRFLGTEV